MKTNTYVVWMIGVMIGFFLTAASFGATEISFTNRELEAAFTLIRPELNQLSLNEQSGVFSPAPALQYFGIDEQRFDIDFKNLLLDIADVEFDGLKAKMPRVEFQNGAFVLILPIEDKSKVIHSRIGAISVKNVTITANLGWVIRQNGTQELALKYSRLDGSITGTGVLKPAFIIDRVKKMIINSMNRAVAKILNRSVVQENIQKGLLSWAKYYTGVEFHSVVPGSIDFFDSGSLNGIHFTVE